MRKEKSIIRRAKRMTLQSSPSMGLFSRILFRRGCYKYFCLIYSYFRWLDDALDGEGVSNGEMCKIIEEQRELLNQLYSDNHNPIFRNDYEIMISLVIKHDIENSFYLRELIFEMLEGFMCDALRRYSIPKQEILANYMRIMGGTYTKVLWVFTNPVSENTFPTDFIDILRSSWAAHLLHMLRDFYFDLSIGYINISREDVIYYQIDLSNIDNAKLSSWTKRELSDCCIEIKKGLEASKRIKNWRFRFLYYLTGASYIYYLTQISKNEYDISKSIKKGQKEKYIDGYISLLSFLLGWKRDFIE